MSSLAVVKIFRGFPLELTHSQRKAGLSKDLKASVLLRVWSKASSRYLVVDNAKHRK